MWGNPWGFESPLRHQCKWGGSERPPSPPLVRKRLGEAVPLLCLAPCRSSVSHTTVISHGAGGGISTNRIDSQSTNVDTEDVGNAPISYNCRRVRDGGGFIPQGWFVKPGTYRDVDGTT